MKVVIFDCVVQTILMTRKRSALLTTGVKDWLQTRKRFLRHLKSVVRLHLGHDGEDFGIYSENYEREFKRTWGVSDKNAFLRSVENTRIVVSGDFHSHPQSQRSHLRFLREFVKRGETPVVGLECVESKYQTTLDLFLESKISEQVFLEKIKWVEHWHFPWLSYKPIFDFAKKHKLKALALNRFFKAPHSQTLKQRDLHAGRVIGKFWENAKSKNERPILFVIFGNLHLAKDHLPRSIAHFSEINPVVLFQDSESLYFKLAKKGLEHSVDFLRASDSRYCVMNSPPWVKWQSYLMYLEAEHDLDLSEEEGGIDFTDHFRRYLDVICSDLKLNSMKFIDLQVFTPSENEHALKRILKAQGLNPNQMLLAKWLLENDRGFVLPGAGLVVLTRLTVNHFSGLVGEYIHGKISGYKLPPWTFPKNLIAALWIQAVGFFLSKLINHKRKSMQLADLQLRLKAMQPKDQGRKVLALALRHRLYELTGNRTALFKKKSGKDWEYMEACRILGAMFGEKLYLAYRNQNLRLEEIQNFLSWDIYAKDFEAKYLKLARKIYEK